MSPLASLISDSWADVKDFLEEVTLYGSAVGNLCPDYGDLVGCVVPFFVPQSDDFIVQVLDTLLNGTDQELFSRIQQSEE